MYIIYTSSVLCVPVTSFIDKGAHRSTTGANASSSALDDNLVIDKARAVVIWFYWAWKTGENLVETWWISSLENLIDGTL